jgi:hypothetical protein
MDLLKNLLRKMSLRLSRGEMKGLTTHLLEVSNFITYLKDMSRGEVGLPFGVPPYPKSRQPASKVRTAQRFKEPRKYSMP